jgi:hypothetical protein
MSGKLYVLEKNVGRFLSDVKRQEKKNGRSSSVNSGNIFFLPTSVIQHPAAVADIPDVFPPRRGFGRMMNPVNKPCQGFEP